MEISPMEKNSSLTKSVMREWTLVMRAQSLSELTIKERVRVAEKFCNDYDRTPYSVTESDVIDWLASLPSADTRWTYFTHLKALYQWLTITRRIDESPLLALRTPKRPKHHPRPVPMEHIEFVLSQPLRRKTRCMILLAFNVGLRVSEIARIRGQDYDRASGQLTVLGKGNQLAVVPINTQLRPFFESMPEYGWWFTAHGGQGHVKSRSVGDTISHTFRRYGIRMTAHQLRHSCGTQLLGHGVDIRVAQELLRHQSIQTTALYTQVVNEQQQAGADMLPVFLEGADDGRN
ncbi:tyrosine-type recombinase/integrase [Trueperella pyogenes]|uniref:tyrosine-type recombinase/integrase n=1 Tax=Trueperella pyogenes TaxID=1661 RepID=UPI0024BF373D|nr:tyrosine-type recombinase/integrase [Trueperella pyogenes]WHU60392.1 tyrosine-type recombinase/integrase [Trueperella pyogenes]